MIDYIDISALELSKEESVSASQPFSASVVLRPCTFVNVLVQVLSDPDRRKDQTPQSVMKGRGPSA